MILLDENISLSTELATHLVVSGNDYQAAKSYHWACARENRPYIVVKVGRKFARLEWDCFPQDRSKFLKFSDEHGDKVIDHMIELLLEFSNKDFEKGQNYIDLETGWVENLPIAGAEELAKKYFGILSPIFA